MPIDRRSELNASGKLVAEPVLIDESVDVALADAKNGSGFLPISSVLSHHLAKVFALDLFQVGVLAET
jgi:hypothetical protein